MTNSTLITGKTFPVKEKLKALGGVWDAAAKGWRVPADKAQAAREIVAGAGAPRVSGRRPRGENFRKYGWDGVYGSPSYYDSGAYDAE